MFSASRKLVPKSALKPFEAIPGPPGKGLPFIGHMLEYLKKPHGFKKAWKNVEMMKEKYLEPSDKIMKLHLPLFNKENGRVVVLFDPNDIEVIYRNEGKYPYRGKNMEALANIRDQRPDVFGKTKGLVMEDWERWYEVRSNVQQDLLRPKSVLYYLDEFKIVAKDFVDFIRRNRDEETDTMENCLGQIYRYTFESICLVALDKRMGCLQDKMDPKIADVFEASNVLFHCHEKMMINKMWKIFPNPRWQRSYREAQDSTNLLIDFGKAQVEEAIKRIELKQTDHDNTSVLEKMILQNGKDSPIPLVTAIDMIFAGIDTTGNTLAFLLYHLAHNTHVQAKLREEFQAHGNEITESNVGKFKYFQACLRESFRLLPTISMQARLLPESISLQGYDIPQKTFVMWVSNIFCYDPKIFAQPEQFLPERWLERSNSCLINPMIVRQFGHGPRMCIGRRFAELELLIASHAILTNFQVSWKGEVPLTLSQTLINEPDQSIDLQFTDL